MDKNARVRYYDETNFAELMRMKKGKKIGFAAKRITLNISDRIYDEANELDQYMRMGYQNVLKTAMTIGLTKLFNHVSHHKMKIREEPSFSSRQQHKKNPARKRSSVRYATQFQDKSERSKKEIASV